jgi:hypothetical protein
MASTVDFPSVFEDLAVTPAYGGTCGGGGARACGREDAGAPSRSPSPSVSGGSAPRSPSSSAEEAVRCPSPVDVVAVGFFEGPEKNIEFDFVPGVRGRGDLVFVWGRVRGGGAGGRAARRTVCARAWME